MQQFSPSQFPLWRCVREVPRPPPPALPLSQSGTGSAPPQSVSSAAPRGLAIYSALLHPSADGREQRPPRRKTQSINRPRYAAANWTKRPPGGSRGAVIFALLSRAPVPTVTDGKHWPWLAVITPTLLPACLRKGWREGERERRW